MKLLTALLVTLVVFAANISAQTTGLPAVSCYRDNAPYFIEF